MAHSNFSVCRLLSVSESRSRYRRTNEKNHCRRLSRVSMNIATSSTALSKTRTEILTSEIRVHRPWGYRRSFPVPTFRRLLPHHATYSIANLSTSSPSYIWNLSLLCVTLTTCSRTRMPKYIGCGPPARRGTGYRHRWSRPVLARSSGGQDSSVPVARPHRASPNSPIRSGEGACGERKSRHDMAGFAKGMATTSGWALVRCDCRTRKQDRASMDR